MSDERANERKHQRFCDEAHQHGPQCHSEYCWCRAETAADTAKPADSRATEENIEAIVHRGQWIQFVDEGVPRKTHIYRVETLADFVEAEGERVILGTVKWFGRWRGYAFFPGMQTVYEPTCLREIADFCQNATAEHRAAAKESK